MDPVWPEGSNYCIPRSTYERRGAKKINVETKIKIQMSAKKSSMCYKNRTENYPIENTLKKLKTKIKNYLFVASLLLFFFTIP
jgi:hypothetical protein